MSALCEKQILNFGTLDTLVSASTGTQTKTYIQRISAVIRGTTVHFLGLSFIILIH